MLELGFKLLTFPFKIEKSHSFFFGQCRIGRVNES